jgi:ornithine carbamoyltransferase
MAFNLRNKHFLTLLDFTPQEIRFLLDLGFALKKAKYSGTEVPRLKGKNIALIFEKAQPAPGVHLRWPRWIREPE